MKAKFVNEGLNLLAAASKWDSISKLKWNLEEYGVRYGMEVDPDKIRTMYISEESDLLPEDESAILAFGYSIAYEDDEPPTWFVQFEYPFFWAEAPGQQTFPDRDSALKFLLNIIPNAKVFDPETKSFMPAKQYLGVNEGLDILKPKTEKDVHDELMGIDNDDIFTPKFWIEVSHKLKDKLKSDGIKDVKLSAYRYGNRYRKIEFTIFMSEALEEFHYIDVYKLELNYNWNKDGSESKPVTVVYLKDEQEMFNEVVEDYGRYVIWDDPETVAEDYRVIFLEMIKDWIEENEYED